MFRRAINWRPSSSSLIAIFALVMATAGTATAASLITGKQILNGTITSADIKNGSVLGAKELSAVACSSLVVRVVAFAPPPAARPSAAVRPSQPTKARL